MFLFRELIPESDAVVVEPENDPHVPALMSFLLEHENQFPIVVPDGPPLPHDRLPETVDEIRFSRLPGQLRRSL